MSDSLKISPGFGPVKMHNANGAAKGDAAGKNPGANSSSDSINDFQASLKKAQALKANAQATKNPKVMAAAQMYETQFIRYMLQQMRKTVPESEFMPANGAEKMFRDQLDDQYVDKWVQQGGIGLSGMIYDQVMERFAYTLKNGKDKLQMIQPPVQPTKPGGSGLRVRSPDSAPADGVPTEALPKGEEPAKGTPVEVKPKLDPKLTSLKMQFEAFSIGEDSANMDVVSPWKGQISAFEKKGDQNQMKIKHGDGLESVLSFRGLPLVDKVGQQVEQGQRVGRTGPDSGPVDWTLRSES